MAKPDCYTTRDLIGMVDVHEAVPGFFRDTYFSETRIVTSDKVAVGEYSNDVYMAPFSGLCSPGKPVKRRDGFSRITEAKPPMIHLSDTVTPCDNEEYRIDPKTGKFNKTYKSRMEAAVARETNDQRNAIQKRVNWMCGMLIVNGQYLAEGEDMPSTLFDFGRPSENTVDLTLGSTADLWTANTAQIFSQLTSYSRIMRAGGRVDVLMSPEAAQALLNHHEMQDWIKSCCPDRPKVDGVEYGPRQFEFAQLEARNASYAFWTIQETYTDENGDEQPFIPPGGVVLVKPASYRGLRVYGAIPRPNGTLQKGTIIPRDYIDESCDCRKIGSKSRPMPIARNVRASMFLQVM